MLNRSYSEYYFPMAYYNELDVTMCHLFRYASSKETVLQLINELARTPYRKDVYRYYRSHQQDTSLSGLEMAKAAFVIHTMSYNSSGTSFDSYETSKEHYKNKIINLFEAPGRLCNVEIMNRDYRDVLAEVGRDSRFVKYLDPPYHPRCRNQDSLQVYISEMTAEQHQEMVELLCGARGWVLSGYDPLQYGCGDYLPLEKYGAVKVNIGQYSISSSARKCSNNAAGRTETLKKDEFLWYKY